MGLIDACCNALCSLLPFAAELLREDGPGTTAEEPGRREFVAHVPLPDEKEIERMVLERKKQELLSKYASEALIKEETEAKALLNIRR
jgi:pre-mRNA-splicing factor ISY1